MKRSALIRSRGGFTVVSQIPELSKQILLGTNLVRYVRITADGVCADSSCLGIHLYQMPLDVSSVKLTGYSYLILTYGSILLTFYVDLLCCCCCCRSFVADRARSLSFIFVP
jgi:hypothetical protein